MKEIIFSILIIIILVFSCNSKEYKYKIDGYVKTDSGYYPATAYTDTFEFTKDSAWYFNSNKTKVTLYKYKISLLKY